MFPENMQPSGGMQQLDPEQLAGMSALEKLKLLKDSYDAMAQAFTVPMTIRSSRITTSNTTRKVCGPGFMPTKVHSTPSLPATT
jgi:hypothetical protein